MELHPGPSSGPTPSTAAAIPPMSEWDGNSNLEISRAEFNDWWGQAETDALALSGGDGAQDGGPDPEQDLREWWFEQADADNSGVLDANEWMMLQRMYRQELEGQPGDSAGGST